MKSSTCTNLLSRLVPPACLSVGLPDFLSPCVSSSLPPFLPFSLHRLVSGGFSFKSKCKHQTKKLRRRRSVEFICKRYFITTRYLRTRMCFYFGIKRPRKRHCRPIQTMPDMSSAQIVSACITRRVFQVLDRRLQSPTLHCYGTLLHNDTKQPQTLPHLSCLLIPIFIFLL